MSPDRSSSPGGTLKKSKKEELTGLCCLVKKKDRLKAPQTIAYLQEFLDCCERLKDPTDDVVKIFEKIEAWKKSYGDLDQQEKMIREKLSNSE